MTHPLQPLANLFAYGTDDEHRLAHVERRLRSSGRYPAIFRPHRHWLLASRPLPGGIPDGEHVRAAGFAFAQGRDGVLPSLHAFARELQGSQELARYPGDFACIHVGPDGRLHATRACQGLVPIYWWTQQGAAVISTEAASLIHFGGWNGRIDAMHGAITSIGFLNSFGNQCHLEGVGQLQPGQCVTLPLGGAAKVRRYWMPLAERAPPHTAALEREHQAELREALIDTLRSDLGSEGGNLLSFSGGVDSSSLLALSAGTLGLPVMTLSQVPPVDAKNRERELRYVRTLRERMAVKRCWEMELTVENLEQSIKAGPALPRPVLHPLLLFLPRIVREADVQTLFGGEFADEICGSSYTLPDWCAATSFLDLLRNPRRWPKGWTSLPRWFKVRANYLLGRPYLMLTSQLPDWCQPAVHERFAEYRRELIQWINELPWIHRNLFVNHLTTDFGPQNWEVCSHFNVRRSIPFNTRRAIELALRCHPAELVGPDMKRLLRGALRGDVPAEHLFRADKGDFGHTLAGATLDPAPLELRNEDLWQPLEHIVRPDWRRRTHDAAHVDAPSFVYLLLLKALSQNVRAASTTHRPPDASELCASG